MKFWHVLRAGSRYESFTTYAINMKRNGLLGSPCPDYISENVSMKVVRIIQSYVNIVNKVVWKEYDKELYK